MLKAKPGSPIQVPGASGRRIREEGKGVLAATWFIHEKPERPGEVETPVIPCFKTTLFIQKMLQ